MSRVDPVAPFGGEPAAVLDLAIGVAGGGQPPDPEITVAARAAAPLLTTVPVICFGLAGPIAPRLGRRFGAENTIFVALIALAIGCALRLIPAAPALYLSAVIAGIALAYKPEDLVGKQVIVVANLQPAKLMGVESNGMVLAASLDGKPVLLHPAAEVPNGTRVK